MTISRFAYLRPSFSLGMLFLPLAQLFYSTKSWVPSMITGYASRWVMIGTLHRTLKYLALAATAAMTGAAMLLGAARISGTYQGRAPAADAARRVFTLTLAPDGAATWTTLYIGKSSTSERGRWRQNGAEIVLTFDAIGPNEPPRPITFRYSRHTLYPIHWDRSEWGSTGPPALYRHEDQTASPSNRSGSIP